MQAAGLRLRLLLLLTMTSPLALPSTMGVNCCSHRLWKLAKCMYVTDVEVKLPTRDGQVHATCSWCMWPALVPALC